MVREARLAGAAALLLLPCAYAAGCAGQAPVVQTAPVPSATPSVASAPSVSAQPLAPTRAWPETMAEAMSPHGEPHAQPLALAPDAAGRQRWLAFTGSADVALGAWHVVRGDDGKVTVAPVDHWPTGVRVQGGIVSGSVAYVLLETRPVLDQPGGLRGVWIDGGRSPFDVSPLALGDVHDLDDLAARVAQPPSLGTATRNAVSLLSTLRAASTSSGALVRALASDGADVGALWQSTFVQKQAHLDGQGTSPSPLLADRALAIVHDALETQACGVDACESWGERGRAVVRFVVEGGRWMIHAVVEDAVPPRAATASMRHEVDPSADSDETATLLRERARDVQQVLGQAPLMAGGGTIGVGLTDLEPGVPAIAVREGDAARVFLVDAPPLHGAPAPTWEAAFAEVDGDGRTDVVLRMTTHRDDAAPLAWTQVFLAPPASVQPTTLAPDLATALATMDAPDVHAAAHAAAVLPARGVSRDDACRVLSTARTPAGFRHVATSDARVLLFDQPGKPTWRAKTVPSAKVGPGDVRDLGVHCPEIECSATRPYCAWSAGADSQHAWFGWADGQLTLVGVADYDGE